MIYVWAALASITALWSEALFRYSNKSWLQLLPYTIVPLVAVNFFIYKLLRSSDTLLGAFIAFSLFNSVARILLSILLLHEKPAIGVWIALGLIILAQIAKRYI